MKYINKVFMDISEYFAIYVLMFLAITLFVEYLIGV